MEAMDRRELPLRSAAIAGPLEAFGTKAPDGSYRRRLMAGFTTSREQGKAV